MGVKYSEIVDPQNIEKTIADDYQYESKLIDSGAARNEGVPDEGTQISYIKQKLFEQTPEGQAIGVDSEITLRSEVQTEYKVPVVERADGAEFDDIAESIVAKRGKDDIEIEVQNAIARQSASMTDYVAVKIIDGVNLYIESVGASTSNYLDAGANDISLSYINKALAKRGEKAVLITDGGGFFICKGNQFMKLQDLGLVAATSNTMGNMKQDEIVRMGLKGTILGMNLIPMDKLALVSTDHFNFMCERGALRMLLSPVQVDPFQRKERAFKDVLKFKIRLGGAVDGIAWSAAAANIVTNTNLATASNWEIAKTHWDNVPAVVLRTQPPTGF